ncbi:MAG: hypothetical protein A2268_05045 [Candidatus Raymondbacteria bacterium RifOxyA12_full_50_37]|nr:MAG: hypothetical protein A2268_05045 [Candidatus Raymondbacteria bacterium RifOxyA12_full_50_37]OGJ94110.1 MAG: hypothetical protein A2248_12250 [Candidatus Raymondbacteria bacterium RIFOXYA2_FULL_49_16]OGJ96935.1 MAG: hypothetical protein A2453_04850 [Candidatus Raymondbacteria bacterium RIFOXYC2_FULL_50_21]OGK06198.1 MAG: hypothetical protein A2487_04665 [Candidatus Raymondbacteria bacterium RifOxyC12_full_50_8]OGP41857.1 MAG: hypothetical protein A2324_18620 [Candidatus Raymondbacteria b
MEIRKRVLTTLNHRQPDKIPYNINFTLAAREKMVKYYNDPEFDKKLGNCFCKLSTEPDGAWQEIKPDIWRDQFGVHWDRSVDKDIGVVCNTAITAETFDEFVFPNPNDPSRYAAYSKIIKDNPHGLYFSSIGFSLFERAWTLTGMENLLMYMITDPDFVHRLMDKILDFNLRIIERACSFDIDIMHFGDDWGQQNGLIMGADMWREYIKPRVKKMYGLARSKDKFVSIHSCGKIDEIFPDLIECGLNIFNPFQPEVIDVAKMKETFGQSLTFYGGISTQQTLPYGTPAQTRDEVRRLLDVVGKNGGYIASPAHDTPADARPENIAAMIDVLQNQ